MLKSTGPQENIEATPESDVFTRSGAVRKLSLVLLTLLATAISIGATGFEFGTDNNIFHVPYVLRLAEDPQFAGNSFYASLQYFTSVVWPLLRLVATEENVEWVFTLAHAALRLGTFGALTYLIARAGLRTWWQLVSGVGVLAATSWLRNTSVAGGHGLLIPQFEHTEVTWISITLSLALLQDRRLISAAAMTGVTFSINPFVGTWMLFINGFAALATTDFNVAKLIRTDGVRAVLLFTVCALPGLVWTLFAVGDTGAVAHFSFKEYVRLYFPQHFLIEAVPLSALANLALISSSGAAAAFLLPQRRYWLAVQGAVIAIFVVGIPLPYLFDTRLVFNLHMLRVDGIEQVVAVCLCATAGVLLLSKPQRNTCHLAGAVVLLSLLDPYDSYLTFIPIFLALLGAAAFCADSWVPTSSTGICLKLHATKIVWIAVCAFFAVAFAKLALFGGGMASVVHTILSSILLFLARGHSTFATAATKITTLLLICLVTSSISIRWRIRSSQIARQERANWDQFTSEVRASQLSGVFLLPWSETAYEFQLQARRPVWADWKQGAAVMWQPSFYGQWSTRLREVSALQTPDQFIAYAQAHDIHNVVLKSATASCPSPATVALAHPGFVVCRL